MISFAIFDIVMAMKRAGRQPNRARLLSPKRPIPGKVKLFLISGEKSASLFDHTSRFLIHQIVTWHLKSFPKQKLCSFSVRA